MLLMALFPGAAASQQVWAVDAVHSVLDFTVRLAGFNRVRGTFQEYDAAVTLDTTDLTRSSVSLVLMVRSIETGSEQRDDHLRSADFFDEAVFPRIRFRSERLDQRGERLVAVGPLTIRDSTRMVEIPVELLVPPGVDPFGNRRFAVGGRLVLNRRDFGVVGPRFWSRAISDSVTIEFELALRRWDYLGMGWGPADRTSIGKVITETVAARGIEAGLAETRTLWERHRSDSAWNFGAFEFEKAAGRLSTAGRSAEAAAVLDLALALRTDLASPRRGILAGHLAEAAWLAGDRARAAAAVALAEQLSPGEPRAAEIARALGRAAPLTPPGRAAPRRSGSSSPAPP